MLTHFRNLLHRFYALPSGATADPEIARHYPHNLIANIGDITLWLFGSSFVSLSAILPVYASRLTASPMVIGLIPALTDVGWFLPQLLFAPWVERLPRKRPAVLALGAVERLPYLFLPLMALWLPTLSRSTAVTVFIVWLVWKSLGSGFVAIPWQEMVAKVIPVSRRGRFFGTGYFLGQLLGIGGSALAAWLLAALPYPQNFAWSFGVGLLGIGGSFFVLWGVREPASPPAATTPTLGLAYFQRLGEILRHDANFRAFLISRALAYGGGMANGFLAVYAVQQFRLPDAAAGVFTGILYGAAVAGNIVWGPLGDRWGHKRIMELSTWLWLLALGVAVIAPTAEAFYVVFALVGLANSGGVLSDLNIAMEFGPEAERPTYIGLARTVTAPAVFIAPLIGGWIAQTWNYPSVFITAFGFSLAGLVLLHWQVHEPRDKETGRQVDR